MIDPAEFTRRMKAIRLSKAALARAARRHVDVLEDFLLGRKDTRGSTQRDFEAALRAAEAETLAHLLALYPAEASSLGGVEPPSAGGPASLPVGGGAFSGVAA